MERYQEYFEKIKRFKEEQDGQKQRGLNGYNILTSVLDKTDEVRLHTRMLYSLLSPDGKHYQSNLFLDKFLSILSINDFDFNSSNCSIHKEYQNIDLYMTDGDKHIILENKVYAKDQKEQIKRYIEVIQKENHSLEAHDILVIYLSLDKKRPTKYSLGNLIIKDGFVKDEAKDIAIFKSIHYKHEILEWLSSCQYEVQNITNLNEVFKQYIDVVKMINNQYKDKVIRLSDYIKDNPLVYKMAVEIQKALPEVRKSIVDEFFEKVEISLQSKLGEAWTIEMTGDLSTRYGFPFRLYKDSWMENKENKMVFGFEFGKNDYYSSYFGIARNSKEVDIKNDIVKKFEVDIKNLNFKLKTTVWWLHWEPLPSTKKTKDFAEYVMLNADAEETFIKSIMKIVNIFEIESNLLTKINQYLNDKSNL